MAMHTFARALLRPPILLKMVARKTAYNYLRK